MHPEIIRDAPGSCPKCGMALEPKTITAEEEENPELIDMTRRFKVSVALTIPLVLIAMRHIIPGLSSLDNLLPPALMKWLELILATPVVLWGAWPFFVRGWQSVVTWNPNMFTLIGLGVGVAYLYSLVAALFPGLFPASFRGEGGEVSVYFEAAACYHCPRTPGTGARTPGADKDRCCDKGTSGACPEDRTQDKGR